MFRCSAMFNGDRRPVVKLLLSLAVDYLKKNNRSAFTGNSTVALFCLIVAIGRVYCASVYTPRLVSGINFLVLSVNLISAPLSLSFLFILLPLLLTL